MAQQTINIGASPNDGTGTPLRTAFQYTNSNFSELYTAVGPSGNNIVVPGNATITGDLTVDTSTLKVDSANNRVGVGTATPYATLHANSAIAAANFDWTTTFTAPTVGLLATSNNSSAWIRIATLDSNPTHDPYINFLTSGGQNWSVGIDNSDSDKFKIALSNGFTGSNEIFAVDPSAVFSWFDGAGGTRMTLNSTGLGVGTATHSVKLGVVDAGNTFAATFRGNGGTDFVAIGTTGFGASINAYTAGFASAADLILQPNGGNVGIGVTPSAKFDVGLTGAGTPRIQFTSASDNPIYQTQRYSGSGSDYLGERLITGGGFFFQSAPAAAVGSQTFTTRMTLDADGRLILLASTTTPATLATNGQLTFTATSNTNLRFSYRGSDGVTRTADLTLA